MTLLSSISAVFEATRENEGFQHALSTLLALMATRGEDNLEQHLVFAVPKFFCEPYLSFFQEFFDQSEAICAAETALFFATEETQKKAEEQRKEWQIFLKRTSTHIEVLLDGKNDEIMLRLVAGIAVSQNEWFNDTAFFDLDHGKQLRVLKESPIYSMHELLDYGA